MDSRGTTARRPAHRSLGWLVLAACCAALPAAAGQAPKQVLIEARILEVNRDFADELGIDWNDLGDRRSTTDPSGLDLGSPFSTNQLAPLLSGSPNATVLANPKVTTIENETATIRIGGQIPFSQPQNPTAGSYEDFGIDLDFVPEVAPDGTLRLQIEATVSGVTDPVGPDAQIVKRSATTRVQIDDGQSFAIAGLLGEDTRSYAQTVPVLGDVPTLGRLFGSSAYQQGETTFAIVLSPEVLGGGGPGQVQIETRVLQVNRDAANSFGIDFGSPWSGLQTHTLGTDAALRALQQQSDTDVLANPKVSTLSGNPATIHLGGEVPIPSGNGTAVQYENFGVSLDFTPRVGSDGNTIQLDIQPTVSEVDTSRSAPAITTRRLSTNVELREGETVAIAGLLQENFADAATRVPLLANVPALGELFRSADDTRSESELVVLVTPTFFGPDGRPITGGGYSGTPVGIPRPRFSVGGAGGYFRQDLPSGNGGLGVVGAGNPDEERPFLEYPTAIDAGGGGLQLVAPIPGLGPGIGVVVDGWYASGDVDFDDEVEGQMGVSNGITYWRPSEDPFDGISQDGGGLEGDGSVEFDSARFFTGFQIDATPLFDPMIDEICDAPLQDPTDGAPWSARPSFLFSALAGFDYQRQDSWSRVALTYEDAAIDSFDIHTTNDIELEEWSPRARFRLDYVQPIPKVRGLSFVTGAGFGLGYRTSKADASQHNFCDVRFTVAPGTNACQPGTQDFEIHEDIEKNGFDWSLSTGARFEYDFNPFDTGVTASVGYDFDYVGVSRYRTPTNLPQDGSSAIDHEQEALHRVGVSISVNF